MGKISMYRGGKLRSSYDTKTKKVTKAKEAQAVVIKKDPKYVSKIPVNVFGGNKKFIKMEFVSDFNMDTGATPTTNLFSGQLSFRLNNINLPYIGQASGLPLPQGYTQAAQAYGRFKVTAVKISAEFYNPNRNLQVGMLVVGGNDTQELQAVNVGTSDMKNRCWVKPLAYDAGQGKVTFNRYYNIRTLEGLTKDQFNADTSFYSFPFQSSVATAGTDENGTTGDLVRKRVPKLRLAIASNDTTQSTCKCKLIMHYYVLCMNKNVLPLSTSSA